MHVVSLLRVNVIFCEFVSQFPKMRYVDSFFVVLTSGPKLTLYGSSQLLEKFLNSLAST